MLRLGPPSQGFLYKMRFVYSHFPINVAITQKDKRVEIRNFLGEKVIRVVDCLGDTKASRSSDVKDEIVLQGTDIDCVGRTWCAAAPRRMRRCTATHSEKHVMPVWPGSLLVVGLSHRELAPELSCALA